MTDIFSFTHTKVHTEQNGCSNTCLVATHSHTRSEVSFFRQTQLYTGNVTCKKSKQLVSGVYLLRLLDDVDEKYVHLKLRRGEVGMTLTGQIHLNELTCHGSHGTSMQDKVSNCLVCLCTTEHEHHSPWILPGYQLCCCGKSVCKLRDPSVCDHVGETIPVCRLLFLRWPRSLGAPRRNILPPSISRQFAS